MVPSTDRDPASASWVAARLACTRRPPRFRLLRGLTLLPPLAACPRPPLPAAPLIPKRRFPVVERLSRPREGLRERSTTLGRLDDPRSAVRSGLRRWALVGLRRWALVGLRRWALVGLRRRAPSKLWCRAPAGLRCRCLWGLAEPVELSESYRDAIEHDVAIEGAEEALRPRRSLHEVLYLE